MTHSYGIKRYEPKSFCGDYHGFQINQPQQMLVLLNYSSYKGKCYPHLSSTEGAVSIFNRNHIHLQQVCKGHVFSHSNFSSNHTAYLLYTWGNIITAFAQVGIKMMTVGIYHVTRRSHIILSHLLGVSKNCYNSDNYVTMGLNML